MWGAFPYRDSEKGGLPASRTLDFRFPPHSLKGEENRGTSPLPYVFGSHPIALQEEGKRGSSSLPYPLRFLTLYGCKIVHTVAIFFQLLWLAATLGTPRLFSSSQLLVFLRTPAFR